MPRSPAEGAATRGPSDLDVARQAPTRDRRVRSGVDRRNNDHGPPNGIERRRYERRNNDRRSHARIDRRSRDRRSQTGRRGSQAGPRQLPRVAIRPPVQVAPVARRSPAAKLIRALIITLVALACLLAATLTEVPKAGAAAKKPTTGSVRATAGNVAATVTYTLRKTGSIKTFDKLRLTVKAAGRTTLTKAPLPSARAAYLVKPEVKVVDVTGDGILDVVVTTNSGGAHCCSLSSVARSTQAGWSRPITHNWRDYGYKLVDLGGTPVPEFQAFDERFTELYTSFAGSRSPIQIWSLEGGRFADVTKAFPDLVRADLAEHAQAWTDAEKFDDGKGRKILGRTAAAAWIADLAVLGAYDEAKAVVKAATDRGDFSDFTGFPGELGHDLKRFGYIADPALIGLTDDPA